MKYCPQCGAALDDAAVACNVCGANFGQPMGQPVPMQPVVTAVPDFVHTQEFDAKEISEGKVFGLAIYLLGVAGIVIALLAAHDNRYIAFHIRTYLKLEICAVLSFFLCIIPFLGWFACGVIICIIAVLQIICFFDVCKGKAVDPAIIRNLDFLK